VQKKMQKPNARPKKRGREGTREEIIKAGKQKEFINGPKLPDRPPQKKKKEEKKNQGKAIAMLVKGIGNTKSIEM